MGLNTPSPVSLLHLLVQPVLACPGPSPISPQLLVSISTLFLICLEHSMAPQCPWTESEVLSLLCQSLQDINIVWGDLHAPDTRYNLTHSEGPF